MIVVKQAMLTYKHMVSVKTFSANGTEATQYSDSVKSNVQGKPCSEVNGN